MIDINIIFQQTSDRYRSMMRPVRKADLRRISYEPTAHGSQ
jgi:hypothetical protein